MSLLWLDGSHEKSRAATWPSAITKSPVSTAYRDGMSSRASASTALCGAVWQLVAQAGSMQHSVARAHTQQGGRRRHRRTRSGTVALCSSLARAAPALKPTPPRCAPPRSGGLGGDVAACHDAKIAEETIVLYLVAYVTTSPVNFQNVFPPC